MENKVPQLYPELITPVPIVFTSENQIILNENFYALAFNCDLDLLFSIFGLRTFNFAKFNQYSAPKFLNFFEKHNIIKSEEFIFMFTKLLHTEKSIDSSLFTWILKNIKEKTIAKHYYSLFSHFSIYLESNYNTNLVKNAEIILHYSIEEILESLSEIELYCFIVRYCNTKSTLALFPKKLLKRLPAEIVTC